MEWPLLIAIAILSIMWAISTYKWVGAERKAKRYYDIMIKTWNENTRINNQLRNNRKTDLIDDRTHIQRKSVEMEDKDNKCSLGKYVVELKDEVYLAKKHINSYRDTYIITDNVFEALSYENLESAKEDAHIVGGKVLQHKPNLEVVE
ncbi:hypothetical protein [Staphylococcus haemolyticus]|uniref:hypothetical protein n=1 Tax=Staphylococcus haemolyticus TaxID=1283 RepID=UPI0010BDC312|nr:hypothetical protein [Staphylococcus haemolyticus]TXD22819.1 hypothetical protein FAF28_000885 [Staphylococcus haemolyticus]